MNKRDVRKLQIGDYIELRHNLGKGIITRIREHRLFKHDPSGKYPLIEFEDAVTKTRTWCTYLAIEVWPNPLLRRGR